MSTITLREELHGYGEWRQGIVRALDRYAEWLKTSGTDPAGSLETIERIRENLHRDRLTVAFVAEFSRGKTELINALFFADTGVRLLPSAPGRTTMCPTEIFYDPGEGSYIRLLPIETRLSELTLSEWKLQANAWSRIDLDGSSPAQMQEAFRELATVRTVGREEARRLGFYDGEMHGSDSGNPSEAVEVPRWRHALVSFPHDLLKAGLCILDTPGLNSLGAEPELTFRMLPGAQAIIYLLAADTGVTRSDLEVWKDHVCSLRPAGMKGLAVAMNKIDSMWGDLQGEESTEASIRAQVSESARMLGVDASRVFPVSAKQALLAKIRHDDALLDKSRIGSLEDYLFGAAVRDRQELLRETVVATAENLIVESLANAGIAVREIESQIETLRASGQHNRDKIRQLTDETHRLQLRYSESIESLQSGRKVFMVQFMHLLEALSPATIDPIVKNAREQMLASLTTISMKAAMKTVMDDLLTAMTRAQIVAEETRQLAKAIYGRFEGVPGFGELTRPHLSLRNYQIDLEQITKEGEEFRQGLASSLMEQHAVVRGFYATTIAEACGLFARAHGESNVWGSSALEPLTRRIAGRKQIVDARLESLRRISESGEALDAEIATLEQKLDPLRKQYAELKDILNQVSPE